MIHRILSFDGGGIRGQWATTILRRLEEALPGWSNDAELLAGSSIGAVLALGLAIGYRPEQLDAMFQKHGPSLFQPARPRLPTWLNRAFRSGYKIEPLKSLLNDFCGDIRLGDLRRWVVIPTVKLDNEIDEPASRMWEPEIFHNLSDQANGYWEIPARQVILYATATPTFFPSTGGYVDGGIVANNPSMVALAQLQEVNGEATEPHQHQELALFSIGTGFVHRYIKNKRLNWGYVQWMSCIAELMNSGSIQLVDRQCRQFLGDRYHRLCPPLLEKFRADDKQKQQQLVEMAEAVDLSQTITWLERYWLKKPRGRDHSLMHSRQASYDSS